MPVAEGFPAAHGSAAVGARSRGAGFPASPQKCLRAWREACRSEPGAPHPPATAEWCARGSARSAPSGARAEAARRAPG